MLARRPPRGEPRSLTRTAAAAQGFAFVEYLTPEEATAALEQTDGYKLDRQHVFKARAAQRRSAGSTQRRHRAQRAARRRCR